jgi:hypothetical protein
MMTWAVDVAWKARLAVVLRACAAQQADRAAPHTGIPEIGAALSACCADAVVVCKHCFNTANQTPLRDAQIASC